jgi:hypothetical protein
MEDDSLTTHDGQLAKNGMAMKRWMARQCRDGQLAIDCSAQWTAWLWTAHVGLLSAMDGLAMDGLAMDGYGLAIKRWTARQCRIGGLGDVAMDGSRWRTARDGRLGDKALDGSSMDSSRWMARQ